MGIKAFFFLSGPPPTNDAKFFTREFYNGSTIPFGHLAIRRSYFYSKNEKL